MIETIILAVIFAKFKGNRISAILKGWSIYLVLFFQILFIIGEISIFDQNYSLVKYVGVFKVLYLWAFLFPVLEYKLYRESIIGSLFIVVGGLCNDIAIKFNNGKMPVFPNLSYWTGYANREAFSKVNDIHILGSATTKFKILTDVIDLGYCVLSIGDVFIRVFAFIIIFKAIEESNKNYIMRR